MSTHKEIGQLLLEKGFVTERELAIAAEKRKKLAMRFGSILVKMRVLRSDTLAEVLGEQYGTPYVDLTLEDIDKELLGIIDRSFAIANRVLPISLNNGELTVAVADPTDVDLTERLEDITGYKIKKRVCPEISLLKIFFKLHKKPGEKLRIPVYKPSTVQKERKANSVTVNKTQLEKVLAKKKKIQHPIIEEKPRELFSFYNSLLVSFALHLIFVVAILLTEVPTEGKVRYDQQKVSIREFKTYSVEIAEKLPEDLYKPKQEPQKLEPKEDVPGEILDEKSGTPAPQTPQPRRTESTQRTEATQPNYPPAPAQSQPPSTAESSPKETVRNKGILGIMSGKGESERKAATGGDPRSNVDLDNVMRPGTTLKKGNGTSRIREGATNEEMMGAREDQGVPKGIERTSLTKTGSIAPQPISQVSGEGSSSPGRSGTEIRQRLEDYLVPRLQHSYNKELQRNPDLNGKITFRFTISSNGRVAECRITRSTMNDSNFENKVVEQVRRCRFQPIEQGSVTVDWSIVFSRN